MDDDRAWCQATLAFPDWHSAEHTAAVHLAPLLAAAEADELITAWFFIRKAPCWRLRYQPTTHAGSEARTHLHRHLGDLQRAGLIAEVTVAVYEPEVHAFGGTEAMDIAHQLWHHDSRHVLDYLTTLNGQPDRRRELSLVLYSAMLRTAGLDWYEQGDVWARAAAHRDPPDPLSPDALHAAEASVRRLMSVEPGRLTGPGVSLAFAADWLTGFTTAGRGLGQLAATGLLHRGLRDVLAHHLIFAWNRLGLPATTQAALATAAATVVFGHDPTATQSHPRHGPVTGKDR